MAFILVSRFLKIFYMIEDLNVISGEKKELPPTCLPAGRSTKSPKSTKEMFQPDK